MYRIKGLHRKIQARAIFLLLLNFLLGIGVDAQTTTYYKAESFLFSFRQDNDLFLADYGDNAYQLERMGGLLDVSRDQILKGDCHLLIVSHVNAYEYEDKEVVNEASLRAGRIRAYLKTRFDIPHDCVAFYIDRSGNYRDQVHVYKIYKPLPWFANISIHYSESRYPVAVEAAIGEYGAVPYVDLYRRGETGGYDREVYRIDDPLFDRTELEDYRLASVTDTVRRSKRKEEQDIALATTVTTRETVRKVTKHKKIIGKTVVPEKTGLQAEKKVQTSMEPSPVYLAVKTNLLPWCGVVPSIRLGTGETKIETGAFMPNLEVECCFAGSWSVALSAMYSDFAYKDKLRDSWSVSEISLEPRFWLSPSGRFTGLHTGLFAEYGDFDVRGSAIDRSEDILYGRTGCFWSAGLSTGYRFSLAGGLGMGLSVRAGYRSVFDGKKYRYDAPDDRNYLETRFASTGFMLGLRISLSYRFQIR
ncbi:DUF3575 domain-containing protein [Parabacteroides sp. TM07-1AC]|jgi:hypothetical protein|uniref:DUF3575 domain-containing protein n=2 Tax=Parabacteroides sp. TM07-1AC TaxID=2292363 RepID=UPI000EFEB367|nr:DUF3575 domain-containing protein [Parabacteroides sp. TM07-1AC]RHU30807.1 DUF3575 domain-containing protein [Parabacteroides sp. TM07-1AC]